MKAFRRTMRDAYDRTQKAAVEDPEVAKMFEPEFLERLGHWDHVVRRRLAGDDRWQDDVVAYLQARGYGEHTVAHYTGSLKTHAPFLKRISFLFQD